MRPDFAPALTCVALALYALPIFAAQPAYPTKSIRFIVAASAGGASDINARTLAPRLADQLGVSVVIDNRAGAGSMIGAEIVAKAPPDGYTLLMGSFEFAVNPSLHPRIPFDTFRDFAPIAQMLSSQYALTTRPNIPVVSVKQLIEFGKARPGGLNFGTPNLGGAGHLAAELLQGMTGMKVVSVHFKGGGPAVVGLMSGDVDFMFHSTATAAAQVKGGKLRAIAVTGARRFAVWPDVPTMVESGLPGFVVTGWFGVLAPAGTPRDIIDKLNGEIVKAAQHPASKERFDTLGMELAGGSPEEFSGFLRAEAEKWSRVIKSAGLRLE